MVSIDVDELVITEDYGRACPRCPRGTVRLDPATGRRECDRCGWKRSNGDIGP